MPKQDATKRNILYLVLTFSLSVIWYTLIIRAGGMSAGAAYVLLLMWSPGIAGLITTFAFQRNFRGMGWGLGKGRFYLVAYLLPIIYAGIAYGATWLLGLGKVDSNAVEGLLGLPLLQSLTLSVLGAAVLALGEEIGWRGVLVPQLARKFPFIQTAVITGIIWGIWHIPLIFSGDYSSSAPTWYAIVCFMVHITGISFAFTWLRLASGSLWPAVLLHAVHNHLIQGILDKITIDTGRTQYFTTEFGLGLAIMGIVVGLVFWRIGLPKGAVVSAGEA